MRGKPRQRLISAKAAAAVPPLGTPPADGEGGDGRAAVVPTPEFFAAADWNAAMAAARRGDSSLLIDQIVEVASGQSDVLLPDRLKAALRDVLQGAPWANPRARPLGRARVLTARDRVAIQVFVQQHARRAEGEYLRVPHERSFACVAGQVRRALPESNHRARVLDALLAARSAARDFAAERSRAAYGALSAAMRALRRLAARDGTLRRLLERHALFDDACALDHAEHARPAAGDSMIDAARLSWSEARRRARAEAVRAAATHFDISIDTARRALRLN